jgi:hypothetical protein
MYDASERSSAGRVLTAAIDKPILIPAAAAGARAYRVAATGA